MIKVPLHHRPPPKHKHFSQIAHYCSHSHNGFFFFFFFFFFSLPPSLSPSFSLSRENTATFYTPSFGFSISQFLFTTQSSTGSPSSTDEGRTGNTNIRRTRTLQLTSPVPPGFA